MASNLKENCGALKHSVFYCIKTETGDGADKHVWEKEHSFPTFELGDGIYLFFHCSVLYYNCFDIIIWFLHLISAFVHVRFK
jgi:hypothetical protein